MDKEQQRIDYCNGCASVWVSIMGLTNCTYCNKPVKEIGWVEENEG
jgi:hypothetical protein